MNSFRITPDHDRPPGWQALSLFGIPIYIEAGFLFFMAIIFFMQIGEGGTPNIPEIGLICAVIFFSLLVHEYGHALTARAMGCNGIRIGLKMFGGYATHSPTTAPRSLLIVLAGPACSLALSGLAWAILLSPWYQGWAGPEVIADGDNVNVLYNPKAEAAGVVLGWFFYSNLFWGIYNLIPIYPMDGGQAVFYGLNLRISPDRAMLIVTRISMVLCVIVGLWARQNGHMFIAIFCVMDFIHNFQIHQQINQ